MKKTDTEGNHTERFEEVEVVLETGGKNSIVRKKSRGQPKYRKK